MSEIEKIVIILVEPENPDNIGAVARAMKNMGLSTLRLVKPPKSWKKNGKKMSMSAYDVLEAAEEFADLESAVEDLYLLVGTTRRHGPKRGTFILFKEAIRKIKKISKTKPIGILFGKESKGLDNHSLKLCDWVTSIPANPVYPSVNLAQSVMIFAFTLFADTAQAKVVFETKLPYVSQKEIQDVLKCLRPALIALNYEQEGRGVTERILATLHRLFKRSGVIQSEAQMFKGFSRRIVEKTFKI